MKSFTAEFIAFFGTLAVIVSILSWGDNRDTSLLCLLVSILVIALAFILQTLHGINANLDEQKNLLKKFLQKDKDISIK